MFVLKLINNSSSTLQFFNVAVVLHVYKSFLQNLTNHIMIPFCFKIISTLGLEPRSSEPLFECGWFPHASQILVVALWSITGILIK